MRSVQSLAADGRAEPTRKLSSSRRSQFEIRTDILRVVGEGADGPTQIMYKANLSWMVLGGHLDALVGGGCLLEARVGNRRKYVLTEKGFGVVESFSRIVRELEAAPLADGEGRADRAP